MNTEDVEQIIIYTGSKTKKELKKLYYEKLMPQTISIDIAKIFSHINPNIPSETKYHTFLIDENDKVVLVGNPLTKTKIRDVMINVVEKSWERNSIIKRALLQFS